MRLTPGDRVDARYGMGRHEVGADTSDRWEPTNVPGGEDEWQRAGGLMLITVRVGATFAAHTAESRLSMVRVRSIAAARNRQLSLFRSAWLLWGMATLAFVLGVACGGGKEESATTSAPAASPQTATPSPTPEPNKFDTSKASALAHASLPKPADLGADWTVVSQDDFKQEPLPSSAACAPSVTAQKAFVAALETNPAGRASVSMTRKTAGAVLPASGSFQVYIYSDAKAAAAPLASYRTLYEGDAFLKCFEDLTATTGATVKVTRGTPSVAAPAGGVAVAYDIVMSADSVTLAMRLETYAWSSSNALAGVTLSGGKDVVTPALVTTAITKTQAAMAAAR